MSDKTSDYGCIRFQQSGFSHFATHAGSQGCMGIDGAILPNAMAAAREETSMGEIDHGQPRLPPLSVDMKCMSWMHVLYLISQNMLHFDSEGFGKELIGDFEVFSLSPNRGRLCVATLPSDTGTVVGYLHYQIDDMALHMNLVRVHNDYRRQAIGTQMALEVLMHPTTILASVVSYTATSEDSQGIRKRLKGLSDGHGRLCRTPFRVTGQPFQNRR